MEFTIEQLNATIAAIAKAQARATKCIGDALLMCLYFANVKGDAGAANALLACLRKSTKQQGIIALLEAHGNLAHVTIGKKKPEFQIFDAGHTAEEWAETVKDLRSVCQAWESFKPAAEEKEAYDVAAAVEGIIKKADSARANHKDVKGAELVSALNKLLAAYQAAHMDAILGK